MDVIVEELLHQKNWMYLGLLGTSSFGTVLAVKDNKTKRNLALKVAVIKNELEIKLWPKFLHPGIIPLHEIAETSARNVKAFVMPVCKITLASHLQSSSLIRRKDALKLITKWLFQVLCGLRYLHVQNLSHLDLKLDNILLTNQSNAVISDFTHITDAVWVTSKHFMGMPSYWKPPELWNSATIHHSSQMLDIWCYGLIIVEAITRCSLHRSLKCKPDLFASPFDHVSTYLHSIFSEESALEEFVSKAFPLVEAVHNCNVFKDFMKLFLQTDPLERTSANEALNHDVFSSFNEHIKYEKITLTTKFTFFL